MDDRLGLVAYESSHGSILPGRAEDYVEPRRYSETTAREIDEAVRGILATAFDKATGVLGQHRELLTRCAEQLLEHETLSREALLQLIKNDESGPGPASQLKSV